jgi:hypothetical protein
MTHEAQEIAEFYRSGSVYPVDRMAEEIARLREELHEAIEGPDGLNSHKHRVMMYLEKLTQTEKQRDKFRAQLAAAEKERCDPEGDCNICGSRELQNDLDKARRYSIRVEQERDAYERSLEIRSESLSKMREQLAASRAECATLRAALERINSHWVAYGTYTPVWATKALSSSPSASLGAVGEAIEAMDAAMRDCPNACLDGDCGAEWEMEVKPCSHCLPLKSALSKLKEWSTGNRN